MLHRLNPVRLRFIRDAIDRHWQLDGRKRAPLAGKRALDMGCGAGLLAEPLARLGAAVTGVDAAPANIAAAQAHALGVGLAIDYRAGEVEAAGDAVFDLIACLEVVEHVADPAGFIASLAARLAPGGLLILSTPNQTAMSKLALIRIGETIGGIPSGTHDWDKFLPPETLQAHVEAAGLVIGDIKGIALDPFRGFSLSSDLRLDYMMSATRG